jgi:hypothetical protein
MSVDVIDTRGRGWLFHTIDGHEREQRAAGLGFHGTSWYRITPKDASYCLEVLPPIYFPGGFAVSEAAWHDENGQATYFAVVKIGSGYYGRHLTVAAMEPEALKLGATLKGVAA